MSDEKATLADVEQAAIDAALALLQEAKRVATLRGIGDAEKLTRAAYNALSTRYYTNRGER